MKFSYVHACVKDWVVIFFINEREREKVNIHLVVYLFEFKITCFFRKRLTTYAFSHRMPYIPNMRDCSFSSVSFSNNSNRDEPQALIHSHTSIHSLFAYIHIWTPTLRCCRVGDSVVVDNVLTEQKKTNKNNHNNAQVLLLTIYWLRLLFPFTMINYWNFLFSCLYSCIKRKWNINIISNFSFRKIKKHITPFKKRKTNRKKKESRRVVRDHLSSILNFLSPFSQKNVNTIQSLSTIVRPCKMHWFSINLPFTSCSFFVFSILFVHSFLL
jgi:hypothetical protein